MAVRGKIKSLLIYHAKYILDTVNSPHLVSIAKSVLNFKYCMYINGRVYRPWMISILKFKTDIQGELAIAFVNILKNTNDSFPLTRKS